MANTFLIVTFSFKPLQAVPSRCQPLGSRTFLGMANVSLRLLGEEGRVEALRLGRGAPLVLDFWHTACSNCPAALSKLDSLAAKHKNVTFAACALSLCDRAGGPADEEESEEGVVELIDDMWPRLTHCFMTVEEKLLAKKEFGFTSVPFCIVVGGDGTILYKGDPARMDLDALLSATPPVEEARKAFKQVMPQPLSESNHLAGTPQLGFGHDDEDF